MNVIVANKYQELLGSLDIDVIKSINGVFTVEDLVAQFSNFYYNKMIIDITAIDGYEDIKTIQLLSVNFDMSNVILLLDDSPIVNSPVYLSQLVSMGIYNFTKDVNNIKFLVTNPNSYKDVAQYQNLNGFQSKKLNENAVDITRGKIRQRVIGFKNITDGAGSTTLVYLLAQYLKDYYKVKAVEVDKRDFVFFNDNNLESITGNNLNTYIGNNSSYEVILVDLNGDYDNCCDEVIYLIEPGLIKLNKLIYNDKEIFEKLDGKKIVLNKSVLSEKDVDDFEKESGSKVFFNMPYLDDKLNNQEIVNKFLSSLGFSRMETGENKLFNIFQ